MPNNITIWIDPVVYDKVERLIGDGLNILYKDVAVKYKATNKIAQ